ncbi:MAG TPA: adenylate/guanylate cyclase domain-containing protein, partial [Gaiellaceae bacterium]
MSLTFLFSDIEDSTGLLGRLGDGYPEVLAKARELTRGAVADAGGREVECRGDEIFCVFERSEAAADAALAIQRAFTAHRWPAGEHVRVRIGMHTGVAEAADEGYVGLDVHRAARICQAAHGGQVLASADAAEPL